MLLFGQIAVHIVKKKRFELGCRAAEWCAHDSYNHMWCHLDMCQKCIRTHDWLIVRDGSLAVLFSAKLFEFVCHGYGRSG